MIAGSSSAAVKMAASGQPSACSWRLALSYNSQMTAASATRKKKNSSSQSIEAGEKPAKKERTVRGHANPPEGINLDLQFVIWAELRDLNRMYSVAQLRCLMFYKRASIGIGPGYRFNLVHSFPLSTNLNTMVKVLPVPSTHWGFGSSSKSRKQEPL